MTTVATALKKLLGPLLIAASGCLALPAAAQSLYTGTEASKTDGRTLQFGDRAANVVNLGAMSVSTSSSGANSFWVYCLDPLNGANLPSAYTTVGLQSFITNTAAGSTSYSTLFGKTPYTDSLVKTGSADTGYRVRNTTQVYNNLVELYSHAYADSLLTDNKSAAFQYAIWSILGEDTSFYGTGTGGLKYTGGNSGFRDQANAYLTAVTTDNWGSVNGANLSASTSYTYQVFASSPLGGSQTFLAVSKATGGKVSEPASLALVGIAALGVIAGRRRKSKSAA
jgi:hypothetical protein